jgi:hypothetical protein
LYRHGTRTLWALLGMADWVISQDALEAFHTKAGPEAAARAAQAAELQVVDGETRCPALRHAMLHCAVI